MVLNENEELTMHAISVIKILKKPQNYNIFIGLELLI